MGKDYVSHEKEKVGDSSHTKSKIWNESSRSYLIKENILTFVKDFYGEAWKAYIAYIESLIILEEGKDETKN